MSSLAKLLVGALCFNMFLLYLLTMSFYGSQDATNFRIMTNTPDADESSYKFLNPNLAYQILTKLDVFEPFYNGYDETDGEEMYQRAYLGFTADNTYCDKHRAYFVHNPEYVFTKKNFITGYWPADQIRNLTLDAHFDNSMPHVGYHRPYSILDAFDMEMNLNVSLIVTFEVMFYHRHINRQFSCLAQMSNHAPGHDDLYRKDYAAKALNVYSKHYGTRPQCFNNEKFFPKNFLLFEEDQCRAFFNIFNSEAYQVEKKQKGIVYMRKIGAYAHAGEGVFPVDQAEEDSIRELYKNGTDCGKVKRNNIMQHFVHNALLINGRKFDFRMFMSIASTNPFIAYYHDGFLRVSLQEYNTTSGDKTNLLTNSAVNKYAFKAASYDGSFNGKTLDELYEDHMWTFERLQAYLLEIGKINDPNWLDNYLRPEFKKAMIHTVRMSQHSYLKRSSLFELYGVDYMLDDDLNLWFIEGNIQPSTTGFTPDSIALYTSVARGIYDISFGLLRSRMKRVINYVNNLIVSGEAFKLESGALYISDLPEKIQEFQDIIKNRMDPEFEVGPENGWSKIVDENYSGVDRYMGFIREECL